MTPFFPFFTLEHLALALNGNLSSKINWIISDCIIPSILIKCKLEGIFEFLGGLQATWMTLGKGV
jgi:hypothetical protein